MTKKGLGVREQRVGKIWHFPAHWRGTANPATDVSTDAVRVIDLLQRISPSLLDYLFEHVAFPLQRTDEPKSEDAPNNL